MRLFVVLFALLLSGCSTAPHFFPTLQQHSVSLKGGELEAGGLAFITPSTVTGQEQEKEGVALTFADVMKRARPALKVVTLAETLGAVNRAGLADEYRHMYEHYRATSLFPDGVLRQVGKAAGARYLAQLKLQGFSQGAKDRFGVLGLRLVETQYADVRVFVQIWDSRDGSIAWEAMQELRISLDTTRDAPVNLRELLERSARDLIARLP
jgi:hypothetical protein